MSYSNVKLCYHYVAKQSLIRLSNIELELNQWRNNVISNLILKSRKQEDADVTNYFTSKLRNSIGRRIQSV